MLRYHCVCHRIALTSKRKVTLTLSLPRDDDHASNLGLPAEVHHPDGFLHVEVVQYGTAVEALVEITVNGPGSVAMLPSVTDVTFVVTFVVDPRFLLVRQILH